MWNTTLFGRWRNMYRKCWRGCQTWRSVCTNLVYKAGRLDVSNCIPYGRQAEMSFIECCAGSFVRPYYSNTELHGGVLEKLTVAQLLKAFPVLYGSCKFITVFITARHGTLSWARSIQCALLLLVSVRSLLILSSHVSLVYQVLFPKYFATETLYFLSHICATCVLNLIVLNFDHPNIIWWRAQIKKLFTT
jgi:hypothetical protein